MDIEAKECQSVEDQPRTDDVAGDVFLESSNECLKSDAVVGDTNRLLWSMATVRLVFHQTTHDSRCCK